MSQGPKLADESSIFKPKPRSDHWLARWVLVGLGLVGLLLIGGGLLLPKIINSLHPLGPRDWQEMGQRGDLYGGFVNPLLSFLAFMGVLYSIYLQRIDLRESQQEAQRRAFETTFFHLLDQQSRIVEAMDLRNSDKHETARGRDCFQNFVKEIDSRYRGMDAAFNGNLRQQIAVQYRNFWVRRRQDLGHYFRFLYNFIRYVDQSDLPQLMSDTEAPKIKYMRLLRAQLSDYELVLIFYNSFGDHGQKFNTYVGRYNLLDNLQPELVKITDAIEFREGLGSLGPLPMRPALS